MLANSLNWVVWAQYRLFEWLLTLSRALTKMRGSTLGWMSQARSGSKNKHPKKHVLKT